MMNRFGLIIGSLMILAGCSTPKYLPGVKEIDINQYGSYIKVSCNNDIKLKGELIAVEENQMVVLVEADKDSIAGCISISLDTIQRFTVHYAKATHYGWTIPVYTSAAAAFGWYAMAFVPVNLLVTILVTATGEKAYTYNQKTISLEDLHLFARFPQGIPEGIELSMIK